MDFHFIIPIIPYRNMLICHRASIAVGGGLNIDKIRTLITSKSDIYLN